MTFDDDGYWQEVIARTGSNSVANGWADVVAFVESGRADDRALSGLHVALRSLSQECQRQLSARKEARRLEMYGASR